jgi:hypothetical protein
MHLAYRPKFLPRAPLASREPPKRRVLRRLGLIKAAPEPHVAPAALYGEPLRGPYTPGPVLAYDERKGVVLFRDGPAPSWPGGRGPEPPVRAVPPPAWSLWLQGVLLVAAIILGGVISVEIWP